MIWDFQKWSVARTDEDFKPSVVKSGTNQPDKDATRRANDALMKAPTGAVQKIQQASTPDIANARAFDVAKDFLNKKPDNQRGEVPIGKLAASIGASADDGKDDQRPGAPVGAA